ncbi:hypothetical protein L202_05636 [Cryptococcus amylolentus CBS 6039]|uniref:Uncharacterized protein n=2 Tax=Cryptococcus amylolentus TaxID=104669 RepID=A0A1E3HNS7_9TREE|nr:hypothetical protein L202_05636 [Cryptococcus amylolentus CBS 6039]ODN77101.1 hypothetical protein L202_05636 [Cryptococcus amylolentus CBS 6039]ODO04953.1 hypothetical protein I350_05564 [Cryptococcus amylolentus CBS 6273]
MAVFSTMLTSEANGCSHGSSCNCGSSSGRAPSNAAAGDCSTHSGSCTCGSNGRLANECNTNGPGGKCSSCQNTVCACGTGCGC